MASHLAKSKREESKSMQSFKRISVSEARTLIAAGSAQIVDIRDDQSYASSHVQGATHLTNSNLQDFVSDADPDRPLLVYCYHGNSSQSAAAFLTEKGFEDVYSVDGGFEHWRVNHPEDTIPGQPS
ncbi:MAG: thiosulfate sulfurtransferase GlpE [Pseudomonadota bacterium]